MKSKRALWFGLSVFLGFGLCFATNAARSEETPLPDDVPSLITLLHDENPKVRALAARHLGQMGEKAAAAVPELISLLGDDAIGDPHPPLHGEVWRDASSALECIGRPAVPELIKTLGNPDAGMRARVFWTLKGMELPPKESLPLMLLLLQHTDKRVRCWATSEIGSSGKDAQQAIPLLIELAKSDSDADVRVEAISAGVKADTEGRFVIPLCIEALHDKEPKVRGTAAGHLGYMHNKAVEAVPHLVALLGDDENSGLVLNAGQIWRAASVALRQIGRPAAPALINALENPDARIRNHAA